MYFFCIGLEMNFLLFFVMEDKGFAVYFKKQQVLVRLKESIPSTTQEIGLREANIYKFYGEHI
jgi:hypothetical protein